MEKFAVAIFYSPLHALARSMIFAVPLALILTLTLERLVPAQPPRRIRRVGLAHDLVWFLYEPFFNAFVSATWVALLVKVHARYFSSLTFSSLTEAPGWVRFIVALLLLDLCYWVQHYLHHKVPLLWRFHVVHHSQRHLSFFTDFRYHPFEYVVRNTFLVVPFLFLKIDPPVIVAVALAMEWYSRFYHGNIRTNLGPLRYILVTPQSHRIHHSLDIRHREKNFGSLFSFWDVLFRQQYSGVDEYPETGIEDQNFPREQEISLRSLFLTPWMQMRYSFRTRSEER